MRTAVLALVVVLAVAAASPGVAAQSDDPARGGVTIDVYVTNSGDAVWNVSTTFTLESDDDREAFRRLAAEIENGSNPPGFDVETAEELITNADQRTDREMSLGETRQTARLTDNGTTGVVTFSFAWKGFASVTGDRMTVGDAFGEWTLTEDQRLHLHPPPNFGLLNVDPDPESIENGTLTWTGERSFDANEPSVTYTRSAAPSDTSTATGTPVGQTGSAGPGLGVVAAVSGVLLLGGVLAYAAARRDDLFGDDEQTPVDAERAAATASGASDGSGASPDESVDPALLSDEERVEHLLEERGGRMKQADIVSETGWSNAKVSQLLSGMAEEDRIEKLRIGRENLITLPGTEFDGEE